MISTRGRYAIRVLIDLAEHDNGCYIPLKDIAAKDMVAGNLIVGASGKGGGYKLCRKPEEYIIGDVLKLMEESLSCVSCLEDNQAIDCPRKNVCRSLPMWIEYNKLIHDFFFSKKLSDLVKERRDIPAEAPQI